MNYIDAIQNERYPGTYQPNPKKILDRDDVGITPTYDWECPNCKCGNLTHKDPNSVDHYECESCGERINLIGEFEYK